MHPHFGASLSGHLRALRHHPRKKHLHLYMDVSKNSGTPKTSILIGFSIINHPFWGTHIFGNTHTSICFLGFKPYHLGTFFGNLNPFQPPVQPFMLRHLHISAKCLHMIPTFLKVEVGDGENQVHKHGQNLKVQSAFYRKGNIIFYNKYQICLNRTWGQKENPLLSYPNNNWCPQVFEAR